MNKKYLYLAGLLSVFPLLGGCMLFEDENLPLRESDMNAAQIVEKMKKASDPDSAYRNCSTYVIKQNFFVENDTKKGSVEIKFKKPCLFKTTTEMEGKKPEVVIFNGSEAWRICDGKNDQIKGHELEFMKVFSEMAVPSKSILDIFDTVKVFEKENYPEARFKLVCKPKNTDLAPCTIYVDGDTFLIKKIKTEVKSNGNTCDYVSMTKKYTDINKIKTAAETSVSIGSSMITYELVSFELNKDLADSEFVIPDPWYLKNTADSLPAKDSKPSGN